MKGTSNEDFSENFINQRRVNLAPPIRKSTDTDKTGTVQHPLTPIPLESRKVDTDAEIEVIKSNSFWERMSEDKVRLLITIPVISLFLISVIIGIVMYIVGGNNLLLFGGSPVLLVPTLKVLSYYFYHPKEK